ncbi:MAG: glycine oxidase ThiO [Gammaproteobacteria bacterium]|nr:MAG: glycine oxidase ThiO [Gammaproteobacteria bacterium]
MHTEYADVLIIGGGVIGMLTACELTRHGAAVRLLERDQVGRACSWAGGGILSPLYPWWQPAALEPMVAWSQAAYPVLAKELAAATAIDPEWVQSGLLVIDADDANVTPWACATKRRCEVLAGDALNAVCPGLNRAVQSAVWLPDIAQIRSPRLLKALKKALVARGVRFDEHTPVARLVVHDGRVAGVETETCFIEAQTVVVTAGAWSPSLVAPTGLILPIEPVRGQMLLLRPNKPIACMVLDCGYYLIPRRDGLVLVGSTVERTGFECEVTAQAREHLFRRAAEIAPGLESAEIIMQWAGLRPGSPDGVPYVGAHPEVAGLFMNTGHFRNGFVLAPASARLVTDLIVGRPPIINPEPYRPDR